MIQNVRLTQLDGKLPNLALMKLAHFHRSKGDAVTFSRRVHRDMFEPDYDRVYGSAIFAFSTRRLDAFRKEWPDAVVGGTGTMSLQTVEQVLGDEHEFYDYSDYPKFPFSIGFTQRGCRLRCKFCVVPAKEGKPRSVNSINDIWRGDPHPRKLMLLDNDFFGQDQWRKRIEEIRVGDFKICLNQGINVRLINDEAAEALATIDYRDDSFTNKRVYTAWDNLGDEKIFFRGMDTLERAGIPGKRVMAYMLIGYKPDETMDEILYRFNRMVERGILPYPMVFNNARRDLKQFQRWAVRGFYRFIPWGEYLYNPTRVERPQGGGLFTEAPQ
jgi:hypothetical protein